MAAAVSEANRVADELRQAILSGEYADGDRLPSLSELADRYHVTVDVARQAINTLKAERLVATRQGWGAVVTRFAMIVRRTPGRLARSRWGSGEAIQDADTGVRERTVGTVVSEVPAPLFVAEAFGVAEGTTVLTRSRRFLVEHRPVQLAVSYLPLDLVRLAPALTSANSGPGGIYARLAEVGAGPVRFTERVSTRAPYPDERVAMEMPASGVWVFAITRLAYDADGRCVEVNIMVLDGRVYELEHGFDA